MSSARDVVLSSENVSKTYSTRSGSTVAVADTTLELRRGEIATLIGPSGCGKSTMLKMLAGLVTPSSGTIRLEGEVIDGPHPSIGLMFQSATLLPWRTALKNVLLPLETRGGEVTSRDVERAEALLASVGLAGFEKSYPHELSGGMAQRVAICRMLITEPAVLLLDEPFGALDEMTREEMNLELQRICIETKATALAVTHSIPEAVFLSDNVHVMSARPGRIATTIAIQGQRPRDLDAMLEPEFAESVHKLRSALNGVAHHDEH